MPVETFPDRGMLVLASLAEGPKHGHAMLTDIAVMSGVRLGPGTLYGSIARLERQGLIEPLPAEERRQPYRLTDEGRRVFAARIGSLARFVAIGGLRLGTT